MVKHDLREFDPDKVARLDAAMWRAYYSHKFPRMFFLLIRLIRTQMHLSWIQSKRAALHSAMAATKYRRQGKSVDNNKVLRGLTTFYKIVSDHALAPFDYKLAAKLELEWWDIHRYPGKYEKSLEQALADGISVVYNIESAKMKNYGIYRAKAMRIKQPEEIEELLKQAWQSAHKALQT